MRIAIVVQTFAREMGYVSNTLPKYLARLGHDVHVITSEELPYARLGRGDAVFGNDFAARNLNRIGSVTLDGYTVHTLDSAPTLGFARLQGLSATLEALRPDVVCCFVAVGWIALDCALSARRNGFALVVGNHTGRTHFPLAYAPQSWYTPSRLKSFLLRKLPGRWIGAVAYRCVVPTDDCVDVAVEFFGIPRSKTLVMNLPVDNDHFRPVRSDADRAERRTLRSSLGFAEEDVVCVYSGKFSDAKNPLVLAHAVALLRAEGRRVRALFIGAGEQRAALTRDTDATVISFRPFSELGKYFRAADIGVWMDESISYLDAASSGLPLVLGDTVKDVSHLREFTTRFHTDDPGSLAQAIASLLDPVLRAEIGECAATLAGERFAALGYARRRAELFREAARATPARSDERHT